MTRAMLMGPVGSGKSTLALALSGAAAGCGVPAKTQDVQFVGDLIDTPGEYVEHGHFNHALMLTSYEADLGVLLESAVEDGPRVAPAFATMFTCPVVGVVTKIDLAEPDGVQHARKRLDLAAVDHVVEVSALTGQGLTELRALLDRLVPAGSRRS